ncbi:hypothetical protein HN020_16025 [Brevibacillus borstelensis]|jgi:hypothetical protein|uniref:hypothetical protein n=1 Tax=Brevibacillus borstelensis TaxID=45462 RepID=UPI000469B6C6|nr:hypothetical protein [Brevibacillus borstelensis]MED1854119.1 hypothetical protein [Brevibacillus borstelensis]NOU56224.1 hypothetical protein [Brevibacillus borstelensis]
MKNSDDQLEKALREVKASFAVEGIAITEEEEALVRAALKGEMTHEEFLRIAKERALKAD